MTTDAPPVTTGGSSMRSASAGLGLGLAWGVAARVWMRLLSADPQLSWRGTLAVVGSAGLAGALIGLAHAAGRRGATNGWRALALPGVALFLGPGLPFLPAFLLGGWGMRRGPVGRTAAALSVAAAPLLLAQSLWADAGDGLVTPLDAATLVSVAVGAGLLAITSAWAGSAAFGPWSARPSDAGRPRRPVSSTELTRAA